MTRPLSVFAFLLLAACSAPNDKKTAQSASWTPPPAGSIVAADSMKITEDQLNDGYFTVKLKVAEGNTGKHDAGFRYDVEARFGAAEAKGEIVMPFGGESLKPLLRRGEGYSFIMGFVPGEEYGSDTAFHEYYRIAAAQNYIKILPLKGFIMDQK